MATNNVINLSQSGITAYDGAGTFSGRTLQSSSPNLVITNPDGIAGNPSFAITGFSTTVNVTGSTQAMSVATNYIADSASLITFTLPATAALGDTIRVAGKNTGLWKIAQNALQQIIFGKLSSTVGVSGLISSLFTNDCVELRCMVAGTSTIWEVQGNAQGNITVA